jgi:hypothetical protein
MNPLYYTTRFIDEVKDPIRSTVLLQWPPDFNTACVLASLQEEATETEATRRSGFKCPYYLAPHLLSQHSEAPFHYRCPSSHRQQD